MNAPKLSAFPKCYLDDIALGRMELADWIDMSVELEPGAWTLQRVAEGHLPAALARIRRQAEGHGCPCRYVPLPGLPGPSRGSAGHRSTGR